MKKRGILNAKLSYLIATLGRKDLFMIGDAEMTFPPKVEVVDLALTKGVPTFEQVLDAVLDEVEVDGYCMAHEVKEYNPEIEAHMEEKLPEAEDKFVPFDDLRKLGKHCRFAIRTGEATPHANVILRTGHLD